MRKSILVTSMFGAWAMALAYDQIQKAVSMELNALLYAAVATMIFGLYAGFHVNNTHDTKEEA